jgi:hypothetical protein
MQVRVEQTLARHFGGQPTLSVHRLVQPGAPYRQIADITRHHRLYAGRDRHRPCLQTEFGQFGARRPVKVTDPTGYRQGGGDTRRRGASIFRHTPGGIPVKVHARYPGGYIVQ